MDKKQIRRERVARRIHDMIKMDHKVNPKTGRVELVPFEESQYRETHLEFADIALSAVEDETIAGLEETKQVIAASLDPYLVPIGDWESGFAHGLNVARGHVDDVIKKVRGA
jgi:hypothetical protein